MSKHTDQLNRATHLPQVPLDASPSKADLMAWVRFSIILRFSNSSQAANQKEALLRHRRRSKVWDNLLIRRYGSEVYILNTHSNQRHWRRLSEQDIYRARQAVLEALSSQEPQSIEINDPKKADAMRTFVLGFDNISTTKKSNTLWVYPTGQPNIEKI
jgi:hypothetical protein